MTTKDINECMLDMLIEGYQNANETSYHARVSSLKKITNMLTPTREGETETDLKAMFDFIENYDVKMYQAVKDHINAQYEAWLLPVETVVCAACGKENQLRITVDQTDFFVKG